MRDQRRKNAGNPAKESAPEDSHSASLSPLVYLLIPSVPCHHNQVHSFCSLTISFKVAILWDMALNIVLLDTCSKKLLVHNLLRHLKFFIKLLFN